MQNKLNELRIDVSGLSLLKFAAPTMLSNIFMNVYSIVDQLFVSNLLGTDALSATSIAAPFLAIALALGTMIATGGCALISAQMGEGKNEAARQNFSFFMAFSVAISAVFGLLGIVFRRPILFAMGADESLYALCEAYAVPIFTIIPFGMVSIVLQMFFVAAGRPMLGFGLSIIGGVTNMALDWLLLAVIPMGVAGAALATGAGYLLQAIIGVAFFALNRKGTLYFVRPKFDGRALRKACGNGVSEMVGMLAVTVAMIVMNLMMMRLVGSDGVAAAAIVISAQTILSAAYEGYVQGIAPVISYYFGSGEEQTLQKLYRMALMTVAGLSIVTFAAAFPLAKPIALLFASNAPSVVTLAVRGMMFFSGALLLMGFNLFASGFFTALNDGRTSAILSLFRTFVFLIVPLLILPRLIGVDGVWLSLPLSEGFGLLLSVWFLRKMKEKYHYA